MLVSFSGSSSVGCAGLLDVVEAEAAVVGVGRAAAALHRVGAHVHDEGLRVTCEKYQLLDDLISSCPLHCPMTMGSNGPNGI